MLTYEKESEIQIVKNQNQNKTETIKLEKETQENNSNNEKTKYIYSLPEEELKKIALDKGMFVRLLKIDGKEYVDLRRYYKNYPTKKGIRLPYSTFKVIMDIFNN
jgi:hypothetical protein